MKRGILLLTLLASVYCLKAQDPHFSQFYLSPLTLNPALTGMIPGDTRVVANYRSQWGTVTVPFQTMSVATDFSLLTGKIGDNRLGAGLLILNDTAGDSEFSNTQIQVSTAFSKSLNRDGNHFISFGAQYGRIQRSINFSKLYFDNQYDGGDFDQGIASGESLGQEQFWYDDVSAGFAWSYAPSRRRSYYAGIALAHLNEPKVGFFNDQEEHLYRKLSAYLGMEIPMGGYFSIIPRAVYLSQGPAQEINLGALLKYAYTSYNADMPLAFYAGTMTRLNDAQVFIGRVDYGPLAISISYDVNASKLLRASVGHGAVEIGLVYTSSLISDDFYRDSPMGCPIF